MPFPSYLTQKTENAIQKASRVCLITHAKPDADTIGSALALAACSLLNDKTIIFYCPSLLPSQLLLLPKADLIISEAEQIIKFNPDLIISLDASDTQVSGLTNLLPQFSKPPTIINIDHHKTNTNYGDFNLVNSQAASTTQIIFYLLKEWRVEINKEIADLLLLGLITDTSNFSNPATTAPALQAAGELVSLGANFTRLQNYLLTSHSAVFFQELGKILQNISISQPWQIVFSILREEELQKNGLSLEEANGLTNIFNFLQEGNIALIIKETKDGHLQCSMRALKEEIDVSYLAKLLGGGGHAKAAGFTIKGKLVKMEEGQWMVE